MSLATRNLTERQQLAARNYSKSNTTLLRDYNQEKLKTINSKKC